MPTQSVLLHAFFTNYHLDSVENKQQQQQQQLQVVLQQQF